MVQSKGQNRKCDSIKNAHYKKCNKNICNIIKKTKVEHNFEKHLKDKYVTNECFYIYSF